MIHPQAYYLNLFEVQPEHLRRLVAEGLRRGGDYCDLFFENTSYGNLVLRDGQVSSGGAHVDFGVGIRVLSGEKSGYAYSESTQIADLRRAAQAAAAIALHSGAQAPVRVGGNLRDEEVALLLKSAHDKADSFVEMASNGRRSVRKFFPGAPNPAADRYPMLQSWRDQQAGNFVPFLNRIQTSLSGRDPRIIKIMAMLSWSVTDVLMFNSLEELKYDTRPMASLVVSVIFQQGERVENKSVSKSFRCGAEFLSEELAQTIAEEAVAGMDARFDARRPKGGKMSVVMGAGASGILLHEAMGHAFEADFNRKGQSIFADKMGQAICPKGINILDDATIRGNRGALNFDDEGVPGQKTYMVEDGILTSYLHDRISARYYHTTPTGNGRRESFRYAPIPRMRTTYMESGSYDAEEIISSVHNGIYVDEFANGQVKIGEGDFTFYVKSGYLIEDGRLTAPIKDINIIGNGPEALQDIRMVGKDLRIDDGTWTCGKEQSVAVSCGIPTVLIGSLTVGGE